MHHHFYTIGTSISYSEWGPTTSKCTPQSLLTERTMQWEKNPPSSVQKPAQLPVQAYKPLTAHEISLEQGGQNDKG